MIRQHTVGIEVNVAARGDAPAWKTFQVVVAVDIDGLALALGAKAVKSKGGRAILANGLVRVAVIGNSSKEKGTA